MLHKKIQRNNNETTGCPKLLSTACNITLFSRISFKLYPEVFTEQGKRIIEQNNHLYRGRAQEGECKRPRVQIMFKHLHTGLQRWPCFVLPTAVLCSLGTLTVPDPFPSFHLKLCCEEFSFCSCLAALFRRWRCSIHYPSISPTYAQIPTAKLRKKPCRYWFLIKCWFRISLRRLSLTTSQAPFCTRKKRIAKENEKEGKVNKTRVGSWGWEGGGTEQNRGGCFQSFLVFLGMVKDLILNLSCLQLPFTPQTTADNIPFLLWQKMQS